MKNKKLDKVQKNKTNQPDYTKMGNQEKKLNIKSEERYITILEDTKVGYFEVDLKGNYTFVNDSMCNIHDSSTKELLGMNYRQYTEKEVAKKVFKVFNEVYETGLPCKEIDFQIIRSDGTGRHIESSVSLIKDSSSKPTGFRGVTRDITERKKIQEKLRNEEQRFRALADQSSDIIVMIDREGLITYENPAIDTFLGINAKERIGTNAFENVHPEDLESLKKHFYKIFSDINTPVFRSEVRLHHKDGSWRIFEIVASALRQGNIVESAIANLRDITERRRAEEKILHEGQRFRALADHSLDIILLVDTKGIVTYINPAVERILGYKVEERMGASGLETIHPDDLNAAIDKLKILATDTNALVFQMEMRLRDKDGNWHTFETVASNLVKDNTVEAIIVRQRDITERKLAETKLRESEANYKQLFDNSPAAIYQVDFKSGKFLKANDLFCQYIGRSQEEITSLSPYDIVTEESRKLLLDRMEKISQGIKVPEIVEYEVLDKTGKHWILQLHNKYIYDAEGHVIASDVVAHDVTERKLAESQRDAAVEKLRKSEKYFKEVTELSSDILIITDKNGDIKYCSRNIERFTGYKSEEIIGRNTFAFIHPDERERAAYDFSKALLADENTLIPNTFRILHKNGSEIYLDGLGRNLLNNPDISGFVMHVRDITGRKRAEEAVLKEHNFSRSALDSLTVPFFMFDTANMNFFRWNRAFKIVTGYSDDEIARLRPADLIPEFEHSRLLNLWKEFKNTGYVTFEMPAISKNGISMQYLFTGNILSYDGKPYVIGMGVDITERKKAEKDLKKSEERYRSVFENAGLPMVIMEDSLEIFMVNDRFVEMSGYEKDEIEGKMKFLDFIGSRDRSEIMQCFARRKGDKPVEYECQIAHRNGERFDVLIRIGRIHDAGQFIASFTDITSRKQAEVALLESQENLKKENIRLRSSIKERYRFCEIIGKSRVMQDVYEIIIKAAATQTSIIIYGESGTGKELVAKAIHETSDRSRKGFVTVQCGAIPETLMESEFFGYKKGAFTGANMDKRGYLDDADGGTLFLDEAGEIGLNMQVKLLRAISGDGYTPVGSSTIKNADVRIIAATNRNLRDLVKRGVMREDFFYRIHILPIYLPPLRERKDDIPLLVDHFLQLYDKNHPPLPGNVVEALLNYDWPGNIRELQNVLHRYVTLRKLDFAGSPTSRPVLVEGDVSQDGDSVSKNITTSTFPGGQPQNDQDNDDVKVEKSSKTLEAIEKDHIAKALSEHHWHRGRTASALGINRKTLFLKMQKFGLTNPPS